MDISKAMENISGISHLSLLYVLTRDHDRTEEPAVWNEGCLAGFWRQTGSVSQTAVSTSLHLASILQSEKRLLINIINNNILQNMHVLYIMYKFYT